MPRSNRNLYVAIGLAAVFAIAIGIWTWPRSPVLTTYGEENPRNAQYHPGGKNCEAATLASIRSRRERTRETDACAKEAEEYRQNTNDLIQQTRAANAAQAQADIASQQLWTGWLQTLGGFLTLFAAGAAAIYARDAAEWGRKAAEQAEKGVKATIAAVDAAHDANAISRAQFEQGYRPLLHIEPFGQALLEYEMNPLNDEVAEAEAFFRVSIKLANVTPNLTTIILFKVCGIPVPPERYPVMIDGKISSEEIMGSVQDMQEEYINWILRGDSAIILDSRDILLMEAQNELAMGGHPKRYPIGRARMTAENRHFLKPPPFQVVILYSDALGITREISRAFRASNYWSSSFRDWPGEQFNYDRKVD